MHHNLTDHIAISKHRHDLEREFVPAHVGRIRKVIYPVPLARRQQLPGDAKQLEATLHVHESWLLTHLYTADFTRSIIVMTSNVGTREMSELLERRPLGFRTEADQPRLQAKDLDDTALSAARRPGSWREHGCQ